MQRLVAIASLTLCLGGGFLVVHYRHADELRAAAKVTARWDDRRSVNRHSTASERAALPAQAQRMLQSVCFEEGGDTLGIQNCYADAATWMLEKAQENADRRLLGYAGLVLGVALGALGWAISRRKRRQDAAMAAIG